jgi:pimeloyl-ACP methyl ester carboxylesterase
VPTARRPNPPRPPGPLLRLLEGRAWFEAGATLALRPLWQLAPRGDGHPVLVLPGLIAGDPSTAILRRFLARLGYAATPWGQGVNCGPRPGVLDGLRRKIRQLAADHGRTVSLIGWSLGGLYARELAKEMPDAVRLVISMASPFTGNPRASNAVKLYELVSGQRVGAPEFHEPLRASPPVPTTSIWSRSDGVVSWRCCVERPQPRVENIEIQASHLGIGSHPLALFAIADRLAQPEGRWAPFQRDGWRKLMYGDPDAARGDSTAADDAGHRPLPARGR